MNKIKYLFKIILSKLSFLLLKPYYLFRIWWPIWFYVINRKSRRLYNFNFPHLSSLQKRMISDLKNYGVAVTHIEELFPSSGIMQILCEYAEKLKPEAKPKRGKEFLKELWSTVPLIDLNNPFVKFGTNQRIIDIVNSYMFLFSKLRLFTLNMAIPVALGSLELMSQKWHRDPEDKKMCKVFLYLTDVDEAAGPFTYVLGSHHGGPYRYVFPQRPPKGCYPPLGAVERLVPDNAIHSFTGRIGTIIFCDTSGLHKGGYATGKERLMFTVGYTSEASTWPIQYYRPEGFSAKIKDLSPVVRYALE